MACNTIKGIVMDKCTPNLGGIKAIYLADYKEGVAVISKGEGSENTDLVDGSISGWAEGNAPTWVKYEVRKNTASMTSTINNSTEGSSYVTTELALVFSRMDAKKRIAIQALTIGECMACVEDMYCGC